MAASTLFHPSDVLVGFDLGGTVAVLKNGTMHEHTLRVYREYGHIPDDVSDAEILRTIDEVRRVFEGAREAHEDRDAFWYAINSVVLKRLLKNPDRSRYISVYADEIHKHFLEPDAYTVSHTVLGAARQLRSLGIRVVIASNATHAEAMRILEHLRIVDEFDHICTSDQLGARKVQDRFWKGIVKTAHPSASVAQIRRMRCMQVGNSLYSESWAALSGWYVGIYDREGRYAPHSPNVRLAAHFPEEQRLWVRDKLESGTIRFARTPRQFETRILNRAVNMITY